MCGLNYIKFPTNNKVVFEFWWWSQDRFLYIMNIFFALVICQHLSMTLQRFQRSLYNYCLKVILCQFHQNQKLTRQNLLVVTQNLYPFIAPLPLRQGTLLPPLVMFIVDSIQIKGLLFSIPTLYSKIPCRYLVSN
jgi:hypothetical protein